LATVEHVDRTLGSAAATELLYRRDGSRVLRYCLRCLRRPADAEDAVQQTFLQAHRALGRGVEPVAEATWLLTIARNVCLTRVDAIRRRARVEFAEDPNVLAEVVGADDAAPELSVEVVEALARLPERQRLVLFLREWQELSYAEIAVALETTESAVETLLFRARRSLADELGLKGRRRRALDLSALLGWSRSVSGVAVPKVASGVAAVVAVAAVGVATGSAPVQASRAPVTAAAMAVAAAPTVAHARAVLPVRLHKQSASTVVRHVRPVASVAPASPVVETATTPAREPRSTPVSPSSSSTAPATGATPAVSVPATPLDPVVPPVVSPVVASVTAIAETTVQTTAATVDQAVQDVASTVQAATDPVSAVVTPLLPGH
jgi:RNA polymerase sigma-70 factor (ECF subfamily)